MILLLPALLAAAPVDGSPAAARAVVERYYAAIRRHDYGAAYRLWDRGGAASGQRPGEFARGFAHTARTCVRAGAPSDEEGAAGSSYITVPVSVEARLTNGVRQHFAGRYVLRRVNDIDGATAEQRRWHIASALLKPVR